MVSKETRSENQSNELLEFLPSLNKSIDLSDPESMSVDELLQIFERRGFQSLVSKSDPIDRIVSLYYDHIMPMPARCDSDSESNNKPVLNQVTNPTTTTTTPKSPSSPSPSKAFKRPKLSETSLDSIIITSDPKRLTPGMGPLPNAKDERTLTVKLPQQVVVRNRNAVSKPGSALANGDDSNSNHKPTTNSSSSSSISQNHHQESATQQTAQTTSNEDNCHNDIPKKRIKLNRDFKKLV